MAPATATRFDPKRAASSDELDLHAIHDFAVDVVLRAGALLKRHTLLRAAQSRRPQSDEQRPSSSSGLAQADAKASQVDLVTKIDLIIEDFIRSEIQRAWPTHEVVAEESFSRRDNHKQRWQSGRGPCWFIDPLDGTLNATHLFPLHCISIGFSCSHDTDSIRVQDDALVGAIFAPSMGATGTLWSGARGSGAYLSHPVALPSDENEAFSHTQHRCNLADLHCSALATIEGAFTHVQKLPLILQDLPHDALNGILFASEWGKDRRMQITNESGERVGLGNLSRKMSTMTRVAASDYQPEGEDGSASRYVHGVRSLGSSALDLAFVAQGSLDVLWEGGCWEWDVTASVALLLETGGLLTDANPPPSSDSQYWSSANVPRAELGSRRFLAVRGCGTGAQSLEAQERVVREIWKRTDGLDYRRDGVQYAVEGLAEMEQSDVVKTPATIPGAPSQAKAASSVATVNNWQEWALKERKRLTKEEAQGRDSQLLVQDDAERTFGGRLLGDDKDPWSFNAWDHVEPPESYLEMVENKLALQRETRLSTEEAAAFHSAPSGYWNTFYSRHENRFFKDRRWLHLEFPELIAASKVGAPPTRVLEVGCGAGNTVFPLLEVNQNPDLHLFACDYAPEAVNVVKSHALYEKPACGRCTASVWDVSAADEEGRPSLPESIEPHSIDIVVLIFVLSALHPNEWSRAVQNIRTALKPGGLVLIRDYGRHDLPQVRFGKGRMLDENFYVRGDGTRVYFFAPSDFIDMFNATVPPSGSDTEPSTDEQTQSGGDKDFETLQLAIDRRMLLNRKEKKQMFRHWLQAKLRYLSPN